MSEDLVQIRPDLTALAVLYRNETCIADDIFKTIPVTSRSFEYFKYDKKNNLTVPETIIGRDGEPKRVYGTGKPETDTVEEHSLEEPVSKARQKEALQAQNKRNLKQDATLRLTDLLKIRKEITVANMLSNTSVYAGNYKTLSANEKIDNDNVNVVKLLRSGIKNIFYKPNTMICSKDAFYALQENPYVVSAVNKQDTKAGVASEEEIKKLFRINKILIGESVHNTSKKEAAPNFVSCWNNDIIFAYINPHPEVNNGLTFGAKFEYESLQVFEYFDGKPGMQGADIMKVYEAYKMLITCPDCAFLFKNVLI
ncbi:MAG: hypothetical protein ACI37T_05955 [Candidatus Gastranaerophilaceae bacterium]